ncbi:hypothetical protein BJX62DRAFT_35384 [Aspergillus germanicus]
MGRLFSHVGVTSSDLCCLLFVVLGSVSVCCFCLCWAWLICALLCFSYLVGGPFDVQPYGHY